jgi:hypothetical protein
MAEHVAAISVKQIEQRVETTKIDCDIGLWRGLPVWRGRPPRVPDCAIINRSLAPSPQAMTCSFFSPVRRSGGQVMGLGGGIDDVAGDAAGQFAAGDFQFVRGGKIET